MRSKMTFVVVLAMFGWSGGTAWSDYVNPPGWDGDADFTHQTWEFNTDAVPLLADAEYDNPFGDPIMTEVYLGSPDTMFWEDDAMGFAIGRYGMWGGMPWTVDPDDVAVALTFAVPNHVRPAPWYKEMWIQVAYWGSISQGGQVLTVEIARDADFQDVYVVYDAVAGDIEDQSATGAGTTGQFWRFTHTFALPDQPGTEYVRLSIIPADSAAVFFDQVSIDTRCVQTQADCTALAVRSCRDHGGTYLCLDMGVAGGVEPRKDGMVELEIDLDDASGLTGGVIVECTTAWSGSATATLAGNTATVSFVPGLPNQAACTVELSCGAEVCVRGLAADTDRGGLVTPGDASIIKPRFGETPTAATAQYDFDHSGLITPGDFSQIKPKFGNSAPNCR